MLGKIGVEDFWFELFKLSNTVNMSEIMHANIWIPEVHKTYIHQSSTKGAA